MCERFLCQDQRKGEFTKTNYKNPIHLIQNMKNILFSGRIIADQISNSYIYKSAIQNSKSVRTKISIPDL